MTPAYGMREVGGWGIRGWRCHCPACGHLGKLRLDVRTVQHDAATHACVTRLRGLPPIVTFKQT